MTPSPLAKRRSKGRFSLRVELRRATLAFSGVSSALAVALVFATRDHNGAPPPSGFGWEWRTGAILTMPAIGDTCQKSIFDNDSGAIVPVESVSCIEALNIEVQDVNSDKSHVKKISQNFRR